ncbi:MAG: alkaline phosphatase family protein [Anaerolineae bacterium]
MITQQLTKYKPQKLAILVTLALLLLGCLNLAFKPVSWTVAPGEWAEGVRAEATRNEADRGPKTSPAPAAASNRAVNSSPPQTPALAQPVQPDQPGIEHVLIISIDGLRPDALDRAQTPVLDSLRAQGVYCPFAQTIKISVTLPSHASMLGGMVPEKHGILWGLPYIGWPGMNGPTLFNVAHEAGLSTAMVFGKEKLNYLVLSNSVDKLFGVDAHDPEVKERAVEFIQAGLPDVMFVHFPDTDRVGHEYGWMSDNQLHAVTYVDGLIGDILAALEGGGYLESTLLIVTSDHGGHGFGHGDDSPVDRTIPWLAVGPGVPRGEILYRPINTYDTAATVLHALELPIPEIWDGQPVLEIFRRNG